MNLSLRWVALAFGLMLLSGCAGGPGPRAIPNKDPLQCRFDQQLVCTGKSATRIKGESDDIEFCRCERVDKIR